MDPIALGVIAVVVAGLAWWILFKDNTDTSEPETKAPARAVTTVGRKAEAPVPQSAKTPNKPTVKTLPGNAALNSLTKAALEELGRDMGVELDKRKTKANMITDLKAGVKK